MTLPERPLHWQSYEKLLRSIAHFIPTSDQSIELETMESRAFHAMSELWARLVDERSQIKRKRLKRREPDELPTILREAEIYPAMHDSPARIARQVDDFIRMVGKGITKRRDLQMRLMNLESYRKSRNPREAFATAYSVWAQKNKSDVNDA